MMTVHQWPPILDDCFLMSNFQYQNKPVVIRSTVDVGPAKVRRRYTKTIKLITAGIKADQTEVKRLNSFFEIDLKGGIDRFKFNSPISGTDEEYRFVDPPVIQPITDKYFLITMNLEQMT